MMSSGMCVGALRQLLPLHRHRQPPAFGCLRVLRLQRCANPSRYSHSHSSSGEQTQQKVNDKSQDKEENENDRRRWTPPRAPLVAGVGFIGALYLLRVIKDTDFENARDDVPLTIRILLGLPLREMSRLFGSIACDYQMPVLMRQPIYKLYSLLYGVNLDEMVNKDLDSYENLGAFFNRAIDIAAHRPLDTSAILCSPADGTVVATGEIKDAAQTTTITIKGVPYKVPSNASNMRYCVIYLAPGDYHRCHAPAVASNWSLQALIHTPGHLLPVRPSLLKIFPSLYSINERVTMLGSYKFGRLAMSLVGATNVGSIRVRLAKGALEPPLVTNQPAQDADCIGLPSSLPASPNEAIKDVLISLADNVRAPASRVETFSSKAQVFAPQEEVGGFLLGSTVVLFFDAPKDAKWRIDAGNKVRVGQALV